MTDESQQASPVKPAPSKPQEPTLKVEPVSGETCATIPLNIQAAHAASIQISGVPKGARLTAGTEKVPGVWEIAPESVVGLSLLPPAGFKGTIGLTVRAASASGGAPKTELLEVNLVGKDDMDKRREAFTPASGAEIGVVSVLLMLVTAAFVIVWFMVFNKYQDVVSQEARVSWQLPAAHVLKPGPVGFHYDARTRELTHVGVIDDARKQELVGLLVKTAPVSVPKDSKTATTAAQEAAGQNPPAAGSGAAAETADATQAAQTPGASDAAGQNPPAAGSGAAAETADATQAAQAPGATDAAEQNPPAAASGAAAETVSEEQAAYWSAIDLLAYKTTQSAGAVFLWLLVLAGLSGTVGVQIRSLINFIGVACFKNALDVGRWWPWYFLRPLQGFMLGLLAVLVIKAGIFVPDSSNPSGTQWWLAISMLVGFGAEDFTERLRLVSQALFGKSS